MDPVYPPGVSDSHVGHTLRMASLRAGIARRRDVAAAGRTFVVFADDITHEFDDERTVVTPTRPSIETWDLLVDGARVALTL
jgi:hypothetical protein